MRIKECEQTYPHYQHKTKSHEIREKLKLNPFKLHQEYLKTLANNEEAP